MRIRKEKGFTEGVEESYPVSQVFVLNPCELRRLGGR